MTHLVIHSEFIWDFLAHVCASHVYMFTRVLVKKHTVCAVLAQ